MKILVINCGSSSVKFKLFQVAGGDFSVLAAGLVERIGESTSRLKLSWPGGEIEDDRRVASHHRALETIEELLVDRQILPDFSSLYAIAHRVVHGGEKFQRPVVIDDEVTAAIRALIPLAPLHNPYNLDGIEALREKAPRVRQVAVFDTAFHQAMPESSYLYPLPYDLYQSHGVRRYGFHGISHGYLVKTAAGFMGRPAGDLCIITLHLGNGASAAAVRNGKCVDTSMGLTPLEGLVMGTRGGDLDPGILLYLERECGLDGDRIDEILNRESGLKGICGENDVREILAKIAAGDERAELALEIFCRRIKKYIGAYTALLGRLDVLVFAGGIGFGSSYVRRQVCTGLEHLGLRLDPGANESCRAKINPVDDGRGSVRILAVETDEELEMARQVIALSSP